MPNKRTLAINHDALALLRALHKDVDTNRLLGEKIGLTEATVHRVVNGKYAPGATFIAQVWDTFGPEWVTHLFKVVDK